MQVSWTGRNVNLALLSVYVEDFLKNKGFRMKKKESARKHTFFGEKKLSHSLLADVTVTILGDPNDFVVKFFAGERARSLVKLGFLTTTLGGGPLLLRALKSQEELKKLEKEFWVYIQEEVTRLTNSASSYT